MKWIGVILQVLFFTSFIAQNNLDTINVYCPAGKKDGYWKVTGSMRNLPEYCDTCIFEEGIYKMNRKNGEWLQYYPDGTLKSKITFKNGRAIGPYETYYPDGSLEEKGDFSQDVYSQPQGVYTEQLHQNTYPELDFSNTNIYQNKLRSENKEHSKDSIAPSKSMAHKCIISKGLGMEVERCYNEYGDVLMDGDFDNDALFNGKYFIYDEYGLLDRIALYKEGKFVGYGMVE